jgi:HTH-type transcriptional regulator / antitoxin HipB
MQFPLQTIEQLKPIIQGFRKRAGLTQAGMAEKLGITQQSYAQIESNLHATSVERLYTILRLLGVELNFSSSDALPAPLAGTARGDNAKFMGPHVVTTSAVQQRPGTLRNPSMSAGTAKTGRAKKSASSTSAGPVAVKQPDKTKW